MKSSVLIFVILMVCQITSQSDYKIGRAIGDISGTIAEVAFLGYAEPLETGKGIHNRLHARTFIIEHKASQKRGIFVTLDLCFTDQSILVSVMKKISSDPELSKFYSYRNVNIFATHTHSGPGGYSWYKLYNIPEISFVKEMMDAIVNGIFSTIQKAHNNMVDGDIYINHGKIFGVTISRSIYSYYLNPQREREKWKNDGETEKNIVVLKFIDSSLKIDIGMMAFFPLHGVSMHNDNKLVDADNHGYFSYLFEKHKTLQEQENFIFGQTNFVASIPSGNHGDATPNIEGAFCPDGSKCSINNSTCPGLNKPCNGRGPGYPNDVKSTRIIGNMVFEKALELYESATEKVEGELFFVQKFEMMSNVLVEREYSTTGVEVKTCRGAIGDALASGTTDGPGWIWLFHQNDTRGHKFIDYIANLLRQSEPSKEQIACHHPKPVFLDVGPKKGIPWIPEINPISISLIGRNLILITVPGEFTTMSGRRLKEKVLKTFIDSKMVNSDAKIAVVFGNSYHSYVATYEEYHAQRYEGGCTVFGPHTLDAYIQQIDKLAKMMIEGKEIPPGPDPLDLLDHMSNVWPFPDIVDLGTIGKIKIDVKDSYKRGDTVEFEIIGGHPLNMLNRELKSYMFIEKKLKDNNWKVLKTDSDYFTWFEWKRSFIFENLNNVKWEIENEIDPGKYRLKVVGTRKNLFKKLEDFEVLSKEFEVL